MMTVLEQSAYSSRSVAVGIGGAGGWPALAWATAQADAIGARLVLLHFCVPGSPLDRIVGEPTIGQVEPTFPRLARAIVVIRRLLGERRVALEFGSGDPSRLLVDASAAVAQLVIGAGEGGHTVRRVLRHAHCPVVVVRDGASVWGPVVVGVDDSAAGRAAMEYAIEHASEHQLPLVVAHVNEEDLESSREMPGAEVDRWARKYPHVAVRRVRIDGSVADGLIRASAGAGLLVVGDKRRDVIGRMRTGDVPLTVAAEALCPVAVVPGDGRQKNPA